jgi:hypothetical protein
MRPPPRRAACTLLPKCTRPPPRYVRPPGRASPLPGMCAPSTRRVRPVSSRAHPYQGIRALPASTSLIVPPPVRAPLFNRSRLFFIHMRPYFIHSCFFFICMRPYFIRARPTLRPYAPLWQPFVPSIELCALQPMQYNGSLHPAIQRGSDVAATVDKVTPVLLCQRLIWR